MPERVYTKEQRREIQQTTAAFMESLGGQRFTEWMQEQSDAQLVVFTVFSPLKTPPESMTLAQTQYQLLETVMKFLDTVVSGDENTTE